MASAAPQIRTPSAKWTARLLPVLLLAPAIVGLGIFVVYPIAHALIGSTYQQHLTDAGLTNGYVGLQNYRDLAHDSVFWASVKVTLLFNLVTNPFQIGMAMAMALLVNSRLKGAKIYRALFVVPLAVSLPVAAVVWQIVLDPGSGLANGILHDLGIPAQKFLASPREALWTIMVIATWKGAAYWMLFLLAGLQSIPQSLNEAAELDGANVVRRFQYITLPFLKRPLVFVLVADTVANFFLFSPQYLLTQGGPGQSTDVLMYRAYVTAFSYSDLGHALAMMVVLVAIVGAVIAIQFQVLRERNA